MSGRGWKQWIRADEKPFAVVVLTEEHLPEKWLREVKEAITMSDGAIARRPGDVTQFVRNTRHVSHATLCVLILPKSMAKLGSGWTGAPSRRIWQGQRLFACPTCGEVCREEDEEGESTYPVSDIEWFNERKRRCQGCGKPLWQMVRLKENQAFFPPMQRSRSGTLRNPPPVRYPLAEFILRQYRDFFDLAIIDEAHRYNAEATDQMYAYRALVRAVRLGVIEATASTFNGRASSLFTRLHRTAGLHRPVWPAGTAHASRRRRRWVRTFQRQAAAQNDRQGTASHQPGAGADPVADPRLPQPG
jgi:hypothetical protein